jgi:hypothetical protein
MMNYLRIFTHENISIDSEAPFFICSVELKKEAPEMDEAGLTA